MFDKKPGHIKVDFHCHTEYSSDCLVKIEDIIKTRKRKRLDKIAITDHNTIVGALIAKEMDPDGIIVGEEIMTTQGEILAFFVKDEIPAGLEPLEVIKELKKQGAFISVSHPFDSLRRPYWTPESLRAIIQNIDAIEGFNSRSLFHSMNEKAIKFAKEHNKKFTVGSDAHTKFEVGRSNMTLKDFSNAAELRTSLQMIDVQFRYSPSWVKLFSRYAAFLNKGKS